MELDERTLEVLDWPFVTQELAKHTRTPAGARTALAIALSRDRAEIVRVHDTVSEILALTESGLPGPPLGGIGDVEVLAHGTARGEVLDLDELRVVCSTLAALADLGAYLRAHAEQAVTLTAVGEPTALDRKLCTTFAKAFDDRGELSEGTYPVLGELRRRIAALDRRARGLIEALLGSSEYADQLQDRYVTIRNDRFVLPIKAQAKGLGLGIVHDASRTGQTVFIEPHQLVPVNNERRLAEAELVEEERRIRAELSALLGRHADGVIDALARATVVDLVCARAQFARRLDANRPEVASEGVVRLVCARHPVLVLRAQPAVASDLALSTRRPVLVLTGPNAGGKTVALKTIGLCALLVRAGCFVPALAGSRVDVFDDVLADIGDQQTVHEGLSSFSAHLTTLREMLERARESTLLLLDEIAAGTDPAQGGALARALIERFADSGARVVATTHYSPVKAMGSDDARVTVAALEYRDGRPTYRVVPGLAGESHALGAAARVGIAGDVIERARSLMDEGERALHDTVAALEAERARNEELSRRATESIAAVAARERSLTDREARIKQHAREIEEREAGVFVERLRAAEREVRRIVAELQRGPTPERASAARGAIREALALGQVPEAPVARLRRDVLVGDHVRVPRAGITGEVLAVREGTVEIRAGTMTLRIGCDEVELLESAGKFQQRSPRVRARGPEGGHAEALEEVLRVPGNTLDLRGVRVEEGLAKLDAFLDDCMLRSVEAVFVLHGHGTGALKGAVRSALAASPYVAASAPASEEQGGDAFTVARLRD